MKLTWKQKSLKAIGALLAVALIVSTAYAATYVLSDGKEVYIMNGSLTVDGDFKPGGDLVPGADGTYDLGSSSFEWEDGFFDGTLTVDAVTLGGNIAVDADSARVIGSVGLSLAAVYTDLTNYGDDPEATIASGAVARQKSNFVIDTESDGASDDLDTISSGAAGDFIIVRAANSARTVVLKDGTGNIQGPGDCSLTHTDDVAALLYDGANWVVLVCADNAT